MICMVLIHIFCHPLPGHCPTGGACYFERSGINRQEHHSQPLIVHNCLVGIHETFGSGTARHKLVVG